MDNKLPALIGDFKLGLNKKFFDQYKTLDEKQTLYADIKIAANASSWMQADFFKYLWEDTDEKTLNKFAGTVGEPPGTINNYIRTAQAFSELERNPMLTFSHHFQASLSDSYDSKTKKFQTATRYTWLEKAADQRLTTRQLNEEIIRTKRVKELGTSEPCLWCKKTDTTVNPYNLFNTQSKHTDHVSFHDACYQAILTYVKDKNNN